MQPFIPRFAGLLLWRGIFAILLGLCILLWPGMSLSLILLFFGGYLVADGIIHIYTSLSHLRTDKEWGLHLFRGIVSLLLGALTLLAPFITAVALVWYVAAWLLVMGILEIVVAIRLRKRIQGEGWYILAGVLSVVAAVIFMVDPLASAYTFTLILGCYAIIIGVTLVGAYIRIQRRHSQGATPA